MKKQKISLRDLQKQPTEQCDPGTGCCLPENNTFTKEPQPVPFMRRDFMKAMGVMMGGAAVGFPAIGKDKEKQLVPYTVPENKNLDPKWIESLYERGEPEIYKGKELVYVGMPIGGITAGQVYLGGDGKLWLWRIFNKQHNGVIEKITRYNGRRIRSRDGSNYVVPIEPDSPLEQGFKIAVKQGNKVLERRLDYRGFKDITFKGQYPIGKVGYRDDTLPVDVDLLAYSPFVPLDWESSSYPATVMRFTVRNTGSEVVSCALKGWLENATHISTGDAVKTKIRNRLIQKDGNAILALDAPASLASNKNAAHDPEQQRDHGSMSLMLRNTDDNSRFSLGKKEMSELGSGEPKELTTQLKDRSIGKLEKTIELSPGEEKTVEFVISWYFPNLYPSEWSDLSNRFKGRFYKNKYNDAAEAAIDLASRLDSLYESTLSWVKTFYEDATLPHWFLNRTFVNISTLATETCYRLEDGRFWAWEGVGCCPGTCTHVWHYAQAMGRIFPEIERNLREKTDFEVMDKKSGKIDFRAGIANRDAADGQAGIIMRAYRDHQMSGDNTYLERNWNNIKLALNYLIDMDKEDGEANGMIFGEQHNTLDAEWYGNIPVITSLYLCALASGHEMAKDMKDEAFAETCKSILEKGRKNIETLFNDDYGYFVQREDPNHGNAIGIGTGCYIDQVFGQGWAFQIGLGRLFNTDMNKKSLEALWKHNYVPDMGPYRAALPVNLAGRPYALDGEAGLVMCTWPNGGRKKDWEKHWQYGYFNECMSGFEYQAASHMMWEGEDLVEKSLILTRSIHDRYHPSRRNPYNEIECSDHYSRAMASYGVYLAACGFEYHGPKGHLAFAPKWQQENFKAAFTAAKGWGSLVQQREGKSQTNEVVVNYGQLSLQQLTLEIPKGKRYKSINLKLNGKRVPGLKVNQSGERLIIGFDPVKMNVKDKLISSVKY
ncbi:GH116 family glycosyl-hydrolase [Fulvivirgaceae bacterium BMA10]|uniref:GH116 family glycosyl-hydrolase n=1 Tax=Splendidivirga corallicola TaxID=3051826 RepID=A0ABT8KPS9_9BACT|nr:GH116 family glycosyl-hydrolase [Fulvivirgaceae bacterium BMA10]